MYSPYSVAVRAHWALVEWSTLNFFHTTISMASMCTMEVMMARLAVYDRGNPNPFPHIPISIVVLGKLKAETQSVVVLSLPTHSLLCCPIGRLPFPHRKSFEF
jgi:hypothetical protein